MRPEGSITRWIWELEEGDQAAAQQELWNRYFHRLVVLARTQLGGMPRRVEDEEDVALRTRNRIISRFGKGTVPFSLRENRDSPQVTSLRLLSAPHSFFRRAWRGRIEQDLVTMPKPMDRRWMRKKPSFRPPAGFSGDFP